MTHTNDLPASHLHAPAPQPETAELKRIAEEQYSVKAEYAYTIPVRNFFGAGLWEGSVRVFTLENHPSATRVFAWSTHTGTAVEHHVALESRAVPEAAEAVRLSLLGRSV